MYEGDDYEGQRKGVLLSAAVFLQNRPRSYKKRARGRSALLKAAPARRNIEQCSWCPRFVTIERVACLSGAFSAAQKGRAACSGKGPHSRGYSFPAEYMALPPRKYLERVKKRMTIGRLASKATAIIAPSSANFSSAKLTI